MYAIAYNIGMLTIVRSETFTRWLRRLRDAQARARINAPLRRVETTGNLGDAHALGNGISEMRFHFGPGYRVYFIREGAKLSSYCVVVTRTAKGATLGERSKLRLHGERESNE